MEADKFKKWLDMAQQFQSDHFWNQIFEEKKSDGQGTALPLNPFTAAGEYFPKCDLFETEKELVLEAEVPGLEKEDLHVSIQKQLLTISGEFKSLKQNCKYFLKERVNRKFKKEITLPYPVVINKIKIEMKKGILLMTMPYNREEVEDIPINIGN